MLYMVVGKLEKNNLQYVGASCGQEREICKEFVLQKG